MASGSTDIGSAGSSAAASAFSGLTVSRVDVTAWTPSGFSAPLPFTSTNVTSGFSTSLIGTNKFVASATGLYMISCSATSTNFSGVTGAALGYGKNGAGFSIETTSTSAPDGVRAIATFTDCVSLSSGDDIEFYASFTTGTAINVTAFIVKLF